MYSHLLNKKQLVHEVGGNTNPNFVNRDGTPEQARRSVTTQRMCNIRYVFQTTQTNINPTDVMFLTIQYRQPIDEHRHNYQQQILHNFLMQLLSIHIQVYHIQRYVNIFLQKLNKSSIYLQNKQTFSKQFFYVDLI